jgi:putative CocE/NonD family hydrolase
MRDGTILRANIYRPDESNAGGGDTTYPVLLTRTPYGKDLLLSSSALDPQQAARRGYIVVVQDVRGTFTSDGDWFPMLNEGPDGADSVAWAAALPGANGAVGMFGGSYVGYTQWAAANQHPPALKAMVPLITWADPDDQGTSSATRQGVLELGLEAGWLLDLGLDQVSRRHRGDPQALGVALYQLVRDLNALPETGYRELPLDPFGPLARQGLDAPFHSSIHERNNEETLARVRIAHAYNLDLPVLHVGGWYDIFLGGTLRNFQEMQAHGHTNQWLIIGPWTHGNVGRVQGELDFGITSTGLLLDMQADLMTLQLAFFDHWLKGVENGWDARPHVKYFVMGANVWKQSDTWPPANITYQPWYLHGVGRAYGLASAETLVPGVPAGEQPDHFTYDPENPVPTVGGATMIAGAYRPGPYDQRVVEARPDVLTYTSKPCEQPLEVTGPMRVTLYVATDAPDTDFVARLVDVYPDGRAISVTDGIARLSAAIHAHAQPEQSYRLDIDLWVTSIVFLPGHRIRLDVTSSSFPRWERNLNTGANSATTTATRVARQTIFHDANHPSHVTLPVVG